MDFGAGCAQLWKRSAEPPGEHRYENGNNNNKHKKDNQGVIAEDRCLLDKGVFFLHMTLS